MIEFKKKTQNPPKIAIKCIFLLVKLGYFNFEFLSGKLQIISLAVVDLIIMFFLLNFQNLCLITRTQENNFRKTVLADTNICI